MLCGAHAGFRLKGKHHGAPQNSNVQFPISTLNNINTSALRNTARQALQLDHRNKRHPLSSCLGSPCYPQHLVHSLSVLSRTGERESAYRFHLRLAILGSNNKLLPRSSLQFHLRSQAMGLYAGLPAVSQCFHHQRTTQDGCVFVAGIFWVSDDSCSSLPSGRLTYCGIVPECGQDTALLPVPWRLNAWRFPSASLDQGLSYRVR